jgi:hypothetical protein
MKYAVKDSGKIQCKSGKHTSQKEFTYAEITKDDSDQESSAYHVNVGMYV